METTQNQNDLAQGTFSRLGLNDHVGNTPQLLVEGNHWSGVAATGMINNVLQSGACTCASDGVKPIIGRNMSEDFPGYGRL